MICVTIGRGRHRTLLEEWNEAAKAGAELVELRLDCLRSEVNLQRILHERPTPIVLTIRRGIDGGLWRQDEEKRRLLLREGIASGVEYIDLELDVAKTIPRFGKTKRIVSYHNFKEVPKDLEQIAHQLQEANADIVKFAVLARNVPEASRVLEVASRVGKPTIGVAMGPLGVFTRILGRKFGAPFTYAMFNPERSFAPGMPLYHELKRDYLYDLMDAKSEVYGVIGDPIEQSLSPAVHNDAFRHMKMNKVYVPFRIPAEGLKESLESLQWLDIKGLSVTIPHKETIVPLMRQVDGAVERTGSCNTAVAQADGTWTGYNTDYHAAMSVLEAAYEPTGNENSPLLDKQVVILGAGGVARTIAFGLARRGAAVTIANRDEERAAKVAADVGCRFINWSQRAGTPADILINCTPIGMHPNLDDTPVPPAAFRAGMVAFDTVYHPENTMFLKMARERECRALSGVDMFVRQAAQQFKLFTGKEAPIERMAEVVRRKLLNVKDE
jgi:3-dehydroquinate dehydratase / shikimate dehydrogenase